LYQPKVRHVLSPRVPDADGAIDAKMWPLFLAVGTFWKLSDNSDQYRERFRAFLSDRVSINPLYADFYDLAARLLEQMSSEHGREAAITKLLTSRERKVPPALAPAQLSPETELEFVQVYVVNEFIALRVALGGFADFGGVNYCGFFGGANIADEPIPYRPAVL
jgi:hypothetical protein